VRIGDLSVIPEILLLVVFPALMLAASTALWVGFGQLADYLFIAAIGGGALTLAVLVLRSAPLPAFALGWSWLTRIHDRNSGVPYGIALAAAALVVYPQSEIWTAFLSR
jgi:prepilin peptidase CpaA